MIICFRLLDCDLKGYFLNLPEILLKLQKKLRAAAAGKGEFDKELILEGREWRMTTNEYRASFVGGKKWSEVSGDSCKTL